MVTEFLKEKFWAPRKLKKVFYLDEKQRKKRLEFCEQMIQKQIKGEDIFFIIPFSNFSIFNQFYSIFK